MQFLKVALDWLQCQYTQDDRYTDQLCGFSLNFKNKEIEGMFQQFRMTLFQSQFRICTVIQISINIIFSLTIYFQYGSLMTSIFKGLLAIWLCCSLIIQQRLNNKWPALMNLLLVVNCYFNQLILTQFLRSQATTFPYQYLSIALYAMTNFMICSTWHCQFLIVLGFYVQFTDFPQIYMEWQPLVWLVLLIFMLRINNKNCRLIYLLLNKQNKNLSACKEIFDQCVPSSILILKFQESIDCSLHQSLMTYTNGVLDNLNKNSRCEVLYANKFAQQYMGCTDNTQCADQLGQIEVIQQNQERLNLLVILQNLTQEKLGPNQSDYALGNDQKLLSCSKIQMAPYQTEVNIEQYCDISIKSCIWEGQNSILILMSDTTDKILHIAELKELNNYKDQLLATVSHDLKTPLNATQLMLYTIKDIIKSKSPLNQNDIESLLRYVNDIICNNLMLISMINDLLDYSQIRQGSLRLQIDSFQLDDCLDSIKRIFERQTQQKNLELHFIKTNFEGKILMHTDQNRLKQILINLLSNSLKFTYNGLIILKISLKEYILEFIVEDTGIGMPQEIVMKLFQQYSTFNLGNMNQQGVGLGLVISKKLVGLLGPSEFISVDSEEGKGTRFTFDINVQLQQHMDLSVSEINQAQKPNKTRSANIFRSIQSIQKIMEQRKVLIVDDTIFNINVFKVILQKTFDCSVEVAYNGLDAVNFVRSGVSFDLIFMDISMPVMNGYQATKQIRESEKEQKHKPSIIIMCSAFTLEQELENIRESGSDGQIEKPVSIKKLKGILKKYLFIR